MWHTLLLRVTKFFVDLTSLLLPVFVWIFRIMLILLILALMLLLFLLIF